MKSEVEISEIALTERQKDVLDAALALLVEVGDKLTMTSVARRASCSKESLYKWFGDRDGLLTATVQWQASKVRGVPISRDAFDLAALTAGLERFAADWLRVLSGKISIALNRVAVGQAGSDKHVSGHALERDLGGIVLENGPFAMARRLEPVLLLGRDAGLLQFHDADDAFRTFFGLVVRDMQIRLLLGDRIELSDTAIERDAKRATEQFLALYKT